MNPDMCGAVNKLVEPEDLHLASQRIDWASFIIIAPNGQATFMPMVGCLAGDPLVVALWTAAFDPMIKDSCELMCKCDPLAKVLTVTTPDGQS